MEAKPPVPISFLELVEPEYAIVSVGRDQNNLPAESVLKRLSGICDEIYQTDTDGTVIFTFQETGYRFLETSENNQAARI